MAKADRFFCTETWCENERCDSYDGYCPYNCGAGNIPSKCKKWKEWRASWRSYPDNENCKNCKHYKPQAPDYYTTSNQLNDINKYKCYCRSKILPENCPKNKEKENKGGKK